MNVNSRWHRYNVIGIPIGIADILGSPNGIAKIPGSPHGIANILGSPNGVANCWALKCPLYRSVAAWLGMSH